MSQTQPAPRKDDVASLLERSRLQIARALPKHMNGDRLARIALTEIRKNPALGECDPLSFLGAVIQCAQLGLEPGSGLGHAYLIPFNNRKNGIKEVQFIPGYRGLIDLARRSGQVETVSARIVREKDTFEFQYGDEERIIHIPFAGLEEDAGRITHAYAIARLKGGGLQREVMTRAQIDAVRDRGNSNPVWESDFDEMARKTVVRRIAKYLPLSPDLGTALQQDDAAYKGDSQENYKIIDANYEPLPPAHDPGKTNQIRGTAVPGEHLSPQEKAAAALAEKNQALDEFSLAVGEVRERGGDAEKVLGRPMAQVLLGDVNALYNAADILRGWKP